MKSLLSLLFLCFCFTISFAQKSLSGFEKIKSEDLSMNVVPFEKEANAVILYEKGTLDIGYEGYRLIVKRRIKILNEKGFDESIIKIPYYALNKSQSVIDVQAQTINANGSEFNYSTLNSKDIFDVTINQYHHTVKFTLPNVNVGSILEIKYTVVGKNLYIIDAWKFQHDLPTMFSEFNVKIEGDLDYTSLVIGKILTKKYTGRKGLQDWQLNNIPSFKDLDFVYNKEYAAESIKFQLAGYKSSKGYITTIRKWPDLRKELDDIYNAKRNPAIVNKYAETIPNGKSQLETLNAVLSNFKSEFQWDLFRGIYPIKMQKDVIDSHTGNVADLNILLQQILKSKQINAELILLTSRDEGKLLSSFPYLDQFDYVVNLVKLNDNSTYVINAADIPDNDFKFLNLKLLNDYGFLMDNNAKDGTFVELFQFLSENTVDFKYNIKDGQLIEQRKDVFNGYFYNDKQNKNGIYYNDYVKSPISGFNQDNTHKLKFENNKYSQTNLSKIPFSDEEKMILLENPLESYINTFKFNETNRINSVEFDFPFYIKSTVFVNVPESYAVTGTQDFDQIVKINDGLVYSQKMHYENNKLQILYEIFLNKAIFPAKDYTELKKFFESAQKEMTKQIGLKKK